MRKRTGTDQMLGLRFFRIWLSPDPAACRCDGLAYRLIQMVTMVDEIMQTNNEPPPQFSHVWFLPADLWGLHPLCSFFEAEAVMWAVGATALVSFGLTLFAVQSKVSSVTLWTRFAAQPPVKAHSLCCAAGGKGGDAAGRAPRKEKP